MSNEPVIMIDDNTPGIRLKHDPILAMIDKVCANPDFDIAKMERLIEMRNAEIERNSRKRFAIDFAQMQAELPQIEERATGHNIKYASFEDINAKVQPVLKQHGFAMSFRIEQREANVIIKAILMHVSGHSEETSIVLPSDSSGSKNNVQAIGSSTSYGKRYAMCALLNIVTKGEDDDAQYMNDSISEEQALDLERQLEELKADKAKFINGYMKVNSLREIPLSRYGKAIKGIEAKRKAKNDNS